MNNVSLKMNISGEEFVHLLSLLKPNVSYVSFVLRDSFQLNKNIENFIARHHDSLINSKKVTEWPGTILLEGYATLFFFSLNQKLWDEILKSDSFKYWKYPNMLEDLSLYSSEDECVLTSISNENDVFLNVDDNLFSNLKDKINPLIVDVRKVGKDL